MQIDLSAVIRAGDGVVVGQAGAEPQTLTEALVAQRAAYPGARVFLGVNWSGIVRPEHADALRLSAYCGAGANRALADAGVLDIHPHPYSRLGALLRERRIPCDVVLVQVSPANARGEHSLGIAAEYLVPALECCRAIVAEVNEQVPWTYGERVLRKSDFALRIETSRAPAAPPYGPPGETELAIAQHVAPYVPDGATLEFGLGSLPDAVLAALGGRARLRVHSGAIVDGVVEPMRRGAILEAVGGLLLGTRKLLDFAHENPRLQLRSSDYTHAPRVLAGIERFIAINSAVEVDLTGQVNAEVAGGSYVGAVGGALDFIRAANASPGGASLIVLPSSAGPRASRIVARLSGPVATPRSEAGIIVTEHGAADLRGCTLAERARRMLAIAHPAFRASLEREARRGSGPFFG
jgi:acetyl-CoA hydrolase